MSELAIQRGSFVQRMKYALMLRSRQDKLDFFLKELHTDRSSQLLDVGVADIEYSPHDNFLEKQYPYPENITALSIYSLTRFKARYPMVRAVTYEGSRMPFNDNTFDIVHCNAVIEHVGTEDKQVEFIREVARVGKRFFATTPSRMFPFETHTNLPLVHWLPKKYCDKILQSTGKKWASGDYMHLLTYGALNKIMLDARVMNYRILTRKFMGFPVSYYIIGGNV